MATTVYQIEAKLPSGGGWATVTERGNPLRYTSLASAKRARDRLLRWYGARSVRETLRIAEEFGPPIPGTVRTLSAAQLAASKRRHPVKRRR